MKVSALPADQQLNLTDRVLIDDEGGTKTATIQQLASAISASSGTIGTWETINAKTDVIIATYYQNASTRVAYCTTGGTLRLNRYLRFGIVTDVLVKSTTFDWETKDINDVFPGSNIQSVDFSFGFSKSSSLYSDVTYIHKNISTPEYFAHSYMISSHGSYIAQMLIGINFTE